MNTSVWMQAAATGADEADCLLSFPDALERHPSDCRHWPRGPFDRSPPEEPFPLRFLVVESTCGPPTGLHTEQMQRQHFCAMRASSSPQLKTISTADMGQIAILAGRLSSFLSCCALAGSRQFGPILHYHTIQAQHPYGLEECLLIL